MNPIAPLKLYKLVLKVTLLLSQCVNSDKIRRTWGDVGKVAAAHWMSGTLSAEPVLSCLLSDCCLCMR